MVLHRPVELAALIRHYPVGVEKNCGCYAQSGRQGIRKTGLEIQKTNPFRRNRDSDHGGNQPMKVFVPGLALLASEISLPLSFYTDRKSTRLNSSHDQISYAVFCLKKKIMLHGTHQA